MSREPADRNVCLTGFILIPLEPAPAGLKANQPYSESQMVKALKPAAQAARKFDEGFERKQGRPPK
jgi:hypothetical protein